MNRRNFEFTIKDNYFRGMSRQQYYDAMHWLRYAVWLVSNSINWEKFHKRIRHTMLYGNSEIC